MGWGIGDKLTPEPAELLPDDVVVDDDGVDDDGVDDIVGTNSPCSFFLFLGVFGNSLKKKQRNY